MNTIKTITSSIFYIWIILLHSYATISFSQNPILKTFKYYPHKKKKKKKKQKSIPDSCCHLHLLHLLRQVSFPFFFFAQAPFFLLCFFFLSFFCLLNLILLCAFAWPVKLSNSSLWVCLDTAYFAEKQKTEN